VERGKGKQNFLPASPNRKKRKEKKKGRSTFKLAMKEGGKPLFILFLEEEGEAPSSMRRAKEGKVPSPINLLSNSERIKKKRLGFGDVHGKKQKGRAEDLPSSSCGEKGKGKKKEERN